MIDVMNLTKDNAKKRLNEQIDLDYYMALCIMCGLPRSLHRGETYTQSNRVDTKEKCQVWKEYREKIKPIVVWIKRARH